MYDLPPAAPHSVPEALALLDAQGRTVAIDPAFCRAMLLDHGELLNAPVQRLVGVVTFAEKVQPALRRCLAGEVVTQQLVLVHPKLGPRQFSVTYHPCPLAADAVYCAMILRDVTVEKLANDGYVLYSQWREALNAIDRTGFREQSLKVVAVKALERLRQLIPYRQAVMAVAEQLVEAAGGEAGPRTANGWCVVAMMPPGPLPAPEAAILSLPLTVQGDPVGELVIWPPAGELLDAGQIELFHELALRLERALQELLLRVQLSRYTVDLEHAVAERTQELERRTERERLASELHDAVTQSIYSLTLFAEAGRRLASVGQLDRVQEYLTLLGDTSQLAMKQMRLMLYELRPAVLEQVGLVQALRQRLEAVERRAGIDARLEVSEPLRLSPAVEESLYRICQEALNNALKHASARTVIVRLRRLENEVLLEVSDDGVGFEPQGQDEAPGKEETGGLGLGHMRERVAQLNAQLEIDTALAKGTTVRVSLLEPELEVSAVWPASDGAIAMDGSAQRTPEEDDH
jgi:signal transduction histidine kinase